MEKKKIKVLHVLHSVGGVDVSLRLILENINSDEFENVVVHGMVDTDRVFLDNKGQKIKHYNTAISRDISFLNDLKSLYQTYLILKKEKPNVIHAHSAKGGVVGRIVGKLLGINVLYTPQAFSYLSTDNRFKRFVFLGIERLLSFKNTFILASSNSEKVRAITEVNYKKNQVLLFNNSIKAVVPSESLIIKKTWPDQYICTVGRPSYQKNIELMIRVFHELNQVQKTHLVVMGVGHHMGQLESVKNLIKELNMQNDVTLLDWTERSDVFHIIKNSLLYISTARYEGLPYSVIESLALSKPCVVSDCDGNRDLIQDGVNGYVISGDHVEEYKEKILRLLNDEDLRHAFSDNAYRIFLEEYDMVKNILKLESIYRAYSDSQSVKINE